MLPDFLCDDRHNPDHKSTGVCSFEMYMLRPDLFEDYEDPLGQNS